MKDNRVTYPGALVLMEACRQEYQNEKEKYHKLYDRIHIALGVCGIIFFKFVELLDFSQVKHFGVVFFYPYLLLIALTLLSFFIAFFLLLTLAKGKPIASLDCEACRDKKKYEANPAQAALWLLAKYSEIVCINIEIINKKQIKYNHSLQFLMISVILLIITLFIKYNFII